MSRRNRRHPDRIRQRRIAGAEHAAKPKVVIVGDNVVATPVGVEEAIPMATLPPKIPGKHRWVVSVAYTVSEHFAANARDPKTLKLLDHETMLNLALGCWDCEKVLGEISAYGRCEAWVEPEPAA